jgi:hypothetical protein
MVPVQEHCHHSIGFQRVIEAFKRAGDREKLSCGENRNGQV